MSPDDSSPLDFQVDRDDFRTCRFAPGDSIEALSAGQVLLQVDRFALTSNNISYAAAGDLLDYWGFFPGPGRWGRIPAMGFGNVLESRNPEVEVGRRCFGFFPMSRHLVIDAKATRAGMIDTVAHRASHAPVYRRYDWTEEDALYDEALEDPLLLLRGLFLTSFLCDDLLAEKDFHGARSILITSASSKTSIALAHLVKRRSGPRVIGLTSARNHAFVESLGCYDEVLLYGELDRLPREQAAVMVDMAGDGEVVAGVHRHLRDALEYSCTVGGTHWESPARPADLPGPTPEFFFAPARIVKRTEDWGAEGLQSRLGDAWRRFARWSETWMKIRRHRGRDALEHLYRDALQGRLDPRDGHVLSLW